MGPSAPTDESARRRHLRCPPRWLPPGNSVPLGGGGTGRRRQALRRHGQARRRGADRQERRAAAGNVLGGGDLLTAMRLAAGAGLRILSFGVLFLLWELASLVADPRT